MTTAALLDQRRRTLCTFWVGDLMLGVDVSDVQEVLRSHTLTPVPTAPPVIAGLMNLRGQIVVSCDLRHRLGIGASEGGTVMNVVLRTPDGPTSLLVDRIGSVIDVDADRIEPSPSTLDPRVSRLLVGTHQLDGQLLLEIETATLIAELTPSGQ